MDKKSLLGLGLIAAIMGIWLYMSGPSKEQVARNKARRDSVEKVERQRAREEAQRMIAADTVKQVQPVVSDSVKHAAAADMYRDFAPATQGKREETIIENELVRLHISNKGGYVSSVELKKFKRANGQEPLVLFNGDSTTMALVLNAYDRSRIYRTDSFYFKSVNVSPTSVTMRLETAKPGSNIEFRYSLTPGDYLVRSEISFNNMQGIISQTEEQVQMIWKMLLPGQEAHIEKEKEAATIYFKQDINSPDYINPMKEEKKEINEADVKWICFKQQFFNSTIIADKVFLKSGSMIQSSLRPNSKEVVKFVSTELGVPYTHQNNEKFAFNFYFGPNHFNTLKSYDVELEKIIPTGWSIFSYINKWLVIPLFDSLSAMNMGMVILILTVIVKVLLLPIAYKTYMSGARMRVLKPELDVLNAKYDKNADPMKKQADQMALYRKAGVSPFSGCLPLLLQFPILIALFNFVPAAIELRQQSFLWAPDLSTYDSIWTFGYVPFINWAYGDHISLFAMLMFVSTIVYTYMNSSMMPQQNNAQMPGMKFMMYFMPVIFLAVMNKYAAGLSWYYFLANMFTFLQNYLFKYFISDKKIRAELENNMKKPVKVSNFQKRLQDMAKQQQQQAASRKR